MVPAAQLVRLTFGVVASIPVSKIVKDIIANNVTIVTAADAVKVKAGSLIIGAMMTKALDTTIDSYITSARTAVNEIRRSKETDNTNENEEKVER